MRPRVLSRAGDVARVALVQTAASLLAGDRVELDVRCGPGARLRLVDVAALIAHDGRGGDTAELDVRLVVGAHARLEWEGQPLVLAAGSVVRRATQVTLRHGGAALLRDTLVLGRAGELGGHLVTTTDVRLEGRPLHAECVDTGDVGLLRSPVVLGGAKVLDALALYGARAEDPDAYQLHGAGSIRQVLAPSLAQAARVMGTAPEMWRAALLEPHEVPAAREVRHGRAVIPAR